MQRIYQVFEIQRTEYRELVDVKFVPVRTVMAKDPDAAIKLARLLIPELFHNIAVGEWHGSALKH